MASVLPRIGAYEVERRIATGGMAEVFVARREGPRGFQKRVALKRILPQYASDPEFTELFVAEARIAARLSHPNIVQVFDFGEAGGELYIAMELVEGTTSHELLHAASKGRRGRVPLDVALHVVHQTAEALAYAHGVQDDDGTPLEVVHRDVSPANILLTDTGHVKLADFGIATAAERVARTDSGKVRGKLGYMSPEQVTGQPLDARSDVFTLAVVFSELLIATPLFPGRSDIEILLRIRDGDLTELRNSPRDIPSDVRTLIERALAPRPMDRLTSSEFARELAELQRRRGMGHTADRLASLLATFGLTGQESIPGDESVFRTQELTLETERDVDVPSLTSPAIYRIRTVDGQVLGPYSFPRIVQLVTARSIDSDSEISKDGGAFAPASGLPELTRFLTAPALQWKSDEIERAQEHGPLGVTRLVPLFFRIFVERRTGVLHLWNEARRKKIYFLEGRPEFVASTDPRELLGEYLVATKRCLRMEVEMALALLPRYGGRLGDALVGLGVLRPVELFRVIAEQVRWRLLEAFTWREGEWAFVSDVRSHEETFPLGLSPQVMLRDAVQQADIRELIGAIVPVEEHLLLKETSPDTALRDFELPATWAQVIEGVDGRATPRMIVERHSALGMDLDDVYRALFLGLACEFLFPQPV